jgi:hypothetical protein
MYLRIALFSLLVSANGLAADTAYSALRAVSARHGENALNQIIEVRGGKGVWKVIMADRRVPTGAREIQVAGGRIRSDAMAVVDRRGNRPINVNELNLDSDGVLITVNQEVAQPVPEEFVHYRLSNSTYGSTPVWTVALHHQPDGEISSMQIAADTGAVLAKSLRSNPQSSDFAAAGDRDSKDVQPSEMAEEDRDRDDQSGGKKKASHQKPVLRDAPEAIERLVDRVESRGLRLRRLLPF